MKKHTAFHLLIIAQLSLAAGSSADWKTLRTSFSPDNGNRTYLQSTPPRCDHLSSEPGDVEEWPTDPYRHMESRQTRETSSSLNLWFQDPLRSWEIPRSFRFCSTDTLRMEFLTNQDFLSSGAVHMKYQHQLIVIMEEDPSVIELGTYLFQRLPTESTLLSYQRGALQTLRGSCFFSSGHHEVILVGHSSSGSNGTVLSGYGPQELARFVSALKAQGIFGPLSTVSIISCNLGNNVNFMSELLHFLRSHALETKLNLYDSFLSVNTDGKILTRTESVWRSHDHRRRVIAELDQTGELHTRSVLGCAGPVLPGFGGHFLYLNTLEWPRHPQMFVPKELRKKYSFIDCLEGLTWSLFFENERRRAPDYVPGDEHELKKGFSTGPVRVHQSKTQTVQIWSRVSKCCSVTAHTV